MRSDSAEAWSNAAHLNQKQPVKVVWDYRDFLLELYQEGNPGTDPGPAEENNKRFPA